MKISGYTTTRNAIEMDYPFEQSIQSVLQFADEVVVLDSGTIPGKPNPTAEKLIQMSSEDKRIKVVVATQYDWTLSNHGIFDGQTKAEARAACSGDFLWQFDTDEIVHELDAPKIRPLIEKMEYLRHCPIVALPVVEYWGSKGKVRADINPWKARLSKNLPDITHGIPLHLRRIFNGLPYASPGTDTCDYVSKSTGKPLNVMGFMKPEVTALRMHAVQHPENIIMIKAYEQWFNKVIDELPGVFHYSWFSIERKIKQYKEFWTSFWKAMYGPDSLQNSDSNWNPFFEVPWADVTDEMISSKAKELEENTGGHIFHSRWNGTKTPHVTIARNHPKIIQGWLKDHE